MESVNESLKNVSKVLEILRNFENMNRDVPLNCSFSILESIILLEKTVEILMKDA